MVFLDARHYSGFCAGEYEVQESADAFRADGAPPLDVAPGDAAAWDGGVARHDRLRQVWGARVARDGAWYR